MRSLSVPTGSHKVILGASHFLAWASSAIVVGITSYFLNNYAHDQHLIFHEVIAVLTLGFWIPSFVLPFTTVYKHVYLPLNFAFSYLWLTSFIFAAQDYNEASCSANAPSSGHCTLKLTNEAFIFLAFFFTWLATIVEAAAWKNSTETAAVAATGTNGKEAPQPPAETA